MIKEINLKEKTAIELKYINLTHQEISERLDVSKDTIDGWFKETGKLRQEYSDFVKMMDKRRQEELMSKYVESDENILTITTNIMRKIGKNIGEDKVELNVGDFKKAWEIQRVLMGKPTDVLRQDVYDKAELDKQAQQVRDIIDNASKEREKEIEEKKNDQGR